MKNSIDRIVSSDKCTGCMACVYACPMGAVSITEREDLFKYPIIDEKKCVSCGKCLTVCAGINDNKEFTQKQCFAASGTKELQLNSSSGGMFSTIAQWFIEHKQGVVCGADWVEDSVKHVIVDNFCGLIRLRKSKYIQSDCAAVYNNIADYLRKGTPVIFFGTPCQCNAVKKLFGNYSMLYIVDILCMGVPSQGMFDKYVQEELEELPISYVDFRDKSKYGWTQNLVLRIDYNGKSLYINNGDSSYFSAFLNSYSLRKSCVNCVYAGHERVGDLTIGDFWGVERFSRDFRDYRGTSLVLANTEKGTEIFNAIYGQLEKVKKFDISYAIKSNPLLKYSNPVSSKNREFLERVNDISIKENYQGLKSNRADCGIINYWWANDNGAILTAYALQRVLAKNGYTSRLINICDGDQFEKRSGGISSEFEQKYLYTTEQVTTLSQLTELNKAFDHFVVGSDQVFRAEWVSNKWFLDFVDLDVDKIAMAASFGVDELNVSRFRKREIRYLLHRFNDVSIREYGGIELCKKLGVSAQYVMDPVFLLEPKEYYTLVKVENEKPSKKLHIFTYFRDPSTTQKASVDEYAAKLNLEVVSSDDNTSVEKFITEIYTSECVVTDSYHGLCFAIIFHKPFICYYNNLRGNSRFDSLIKTLELPKDRFIAPEDEWHEKMQGASVDWASIEEIIESQRKLGTEWLIRSLKKPSDIDLDQLKKYYFAERVGNAGIRLALKVLRLGKKTVSKVIKKRKLQ